MTDERKKHWQTVYQTKSSTDVSWYQFVPNRSLELIKSAAMLPEAAILDVGGGDCTLVDNLLAAGFTDITVLDISSAALDSAKSRLGAAAGGVVWIAADITDWQPVRRFDLWHDRAVFHFLVDPTLRRRYLGVLQAALVPGGHVVIATFGPEGPTRCSGLDVQRYSVAELSAVLGSCFRLIRSHLDVHLTPAGREQQFLYGWWQTIGQREK